MKAQISNELLTLFPENEQELQQIRDYIDNMIDDATNLNIPVSDFVIDDSKLEKLKHHSECEVATEMPGYSPKCQECSSLQKDKCITDDFNGVK